MRKIVVLLMVFSLSFSVVFAESNQGPSNWAVNEIERGVKAEIFPQDLLSHYKSNITRQDFCKLIISIFTKENGYANVDDLLKNRLNYDYNISQSKFLDLNYKNSDYKYVVAANLLGIVKGVSENRFAPQDSITREQAAKMLVNAYDKMLKEKNIMYTLKDYYIPFADHDKISFWAKDEVYVISELKIMNGVGENIFNPKGTYTREQALLTAVRLYDTYGIEVANDKGTNPNANDKIDKNKGELDQENLSAQIKEYKAEILRLVNEERAKVGVAPLIEGTKYNDYADIRAKECSIVFSHTRPDGSSCFSGLSNYSFVGENIAVGSRTPEGVVNLWMNSSGHRKNILNPDFKELSVGIFCDSTSKYNWYFVQIFYTPYSKDVSDSNNLETEDSNDSNEDLSGKIESYKSEVLRLVNEERAKVGVAPLIEGTKYNDYADIRAKECSTVFSHARPDGSSCFSGLSNYSFVGENIAAGSRTPEGVVNLWMNSSGHRKNILNPDFKELSVGIYYDSVGTSRWYWVQIFYTPYSKDVSDSNNLETEDSNDSNDSSEDLSGKIESYKSEVLRLVNEERAKEGVAPLAEGIKYNDYADIRAKECSSVFSHTRPDGSSCFSGLSNYYTAGENIAAGSRTPEAVVNAWMNSPGHRSNILNPNFKEMSVGFYNNKYGYYWVQIFYA